MSSSIHLDKPWLELSTEIVSELPGQLGVYQLGNEAGEVLFIGYAGGHSRFGLRSELAQWLGEPDSEVRKFRCEVNMQYTTRYQELLMVYVAEHDRVPVRNSESLAELGRLKLA